MSSIKAAVREYIVDNFIMGGDGPAFADTDSFMAQHIVDSTGFLELVTYLEETWGFVVEDAEMIPENLDSLASIEAYVLAKTGAAAPAASAAQAIAA